MMPMRRMVLAFLCACVLALLPGRSVGAPGKRGLSRAEQEANALTDRANDLQQRGFINEAIRYCQEALALDPVPRRHRNLALLLEQAGRLAEALAEYQRFQRDQMGEIPEYRQDVAERIESLIARLGAVVLLPLPGPSSLPVDVGRFTEPVMVRLVEAESDRPTCLLVRSPGPVPASRRYLCQPGGVHAELRVAGQIAATRRVEVVAGKEQPVEFQPRVEVTVRSSRPRPVLTLDQAPLAVPAPGPRAPGNSQTLTLTLPLLLGAHELRAQDAKEVLLRRFSLREGTPQMVELQFSRRRPWLPWVIGGAAVLCAAGIAVGVGVALSQPQPVPPDLILPPPALGR